MICFRKHDGYEQLCFSDDLMSACTEMSEWTM